MDLLLTAEKESCLVPSLVAQKVSLMAGLMELVSVTYWEMLKVSKMALQKDCKTVERWERQSD